jgi:putative NADH-flavin reductase
MPRLIVVGATGSLGSQVLRQALAAGHQVTALVRAPSKLPAEVLAHVSVHRGDLSYLAPAELAEIIRGHDALINCAGHVAEGQVFVDLIDRLVTGIELLPEAVRPLCWFLAGVALLDIDRSGRKGVDLPKIKSTYWPHRVNLERLSRSGLDWRLLCPGPMVDQPAIGTNRLRLSLDTWPVRVPAIARVLPGPFFLPVFAYLIPQVIVPYADAAAVMLANVQRGDAMAHHRVGVALPPGMRGKKSRWTGKR